MAAAASGGVPPLHVSIQITTTGARAAANAMKGVSQASTGMTRGFGAGIISARTLGDAMRMTASLMKYTVAGAFMSIGKSAIQAARNFELSFSRIKGLVGISSDAIEEMKKGVLEMATETTRGPEELAEALYFVTSAGIRDASSAMRILEASARAAASGLGDTKTVADAVTSALNAYGEANLSASEATDVITAAVREGKAEADTMAPAFSKVLPVAAAFGASFEDVAAAMAALSRTGMTAGTAGIYVRQVLSQLLKPSKQASEALAAVGTSATAIRQQVQEEGLFAALQTLSQRLGGIENAEAFAKVFGNVRALTAVLQLVGPAAEENAVIFQRLQNSAGDSADAFDAYRDTIDARFNKALAASRTALIEIGYTIKPIVTSLLEFATAAAKIATALLEWKPLGIPVVKSLVGIVAGVALIVSGSSALLKTTSALIRLFANLSIVLRGTQLMYDANTRSVYTLTAAQAKLAGAQGVSNLRAMGYAKVTTISTRISGLFAGALARVRSAMVAASLATTNAGKAFLFLKTAMGPIGWIILGITAAVSAFVLIKKRMDEAAKGGKSVAKELGNINELLDETVKYGKSELLFNVGVNVQDAKMQSDIERAKQQIEDQAPDFLEGVGDTLAAIGEESKAAYLNALMTGTFGGMTKEAQETIKNLLAQQFGIPAKDIASATIPKTTGDAVADALIFAAVAGAKNASARAKNALGGDTFDDLNEAIRQGMEKSAKAREGGMFVPDILDGGVLDALKEFGRSFTDFAQETEGNISPLIVSLQKMQKAGTLTGTTLEYVLGSGLKGLTGDLNLQSESAGNLAEIFSKTANEAALISMIMKTTGADNAKATAVYETLREELDKLPDGPNKSVQAFELFSKAMGEARTEANRFDASQQKVIDSLELTQQMLKDTVEEFENQTSVIKELEKAQRGLLGINLTIEEANNALMGQYQSLGNAVKDSGGSFDQVSEKGIAAREELRANAEAVFDLANAYYAAGDATGAGEVLAKGLGQLVDVAAQAGGDAAGVGAANLLAELGFTAQNFSDSLLAAETAIDASAAGTGKSVVDGIARGISQNQSSMSAALVSALNNVMVVARDEIEAKSPSRRTAREVGLPMGQGVQVGFTKYMASSKFKGAMSKSLDKAIKNAAKTGGRVGLSKFFTDFLDKKQAVETPAQDFVKATIGRMKDIIGSLSDYINSQLNFRKAQADLAKLINMQKGLDDRRRKAAREQQYAETRFGRGGGAEVTGYEQAQIDELQLAFERTSRDYAMGRASYIELVDAEIALYEARQAAAEINDDVIGAQNDFIDASVDVENAELEMADATVNVLSAYQDVQEAAAELYMNHKELAGVYNDLAAATGIATGKLTVGKTELTDLGKEVSELGGYASTVGGYVSTLGNNVDITGQAFRRQFDGPGGIFSKIVQTSGKIENLTNSIGVNFTDLSKGLVDPESQFMKDLNSLPKGMWEAIKIGAQEAIDKSPLTLSISVNAQVDKNGSGSISWSVSPIVPTTPTPPPSGAYIPGYAGIGETRTAQQIASNRPKKTSSASTTAKKAVGGPVAGMTPYLVGEVGPEMFIPKVSGTIVTNNALERYTRTRQTGISQSPSSQNNISVTVNNPVPQAAEDSITRRMKVLSNSGLFG